MHPSELGSSSEWNHCICVMRNGGAGLPPSPCFQIWGFTGSQQVLGEVGVGGDVVRGHLPLRALPLK